MKLICSSCEQEPHPLDWRCGRCGSLLDFDRLPEFNPSEINQKIFNLWRYQALLGIEARFSLGEGMTPLVKSEIEGHSFFAKLEYLNPTGSYKDRGTTVMMNHIASYGVKEVVEDSSGNAGASVAAFSSIAGIQSHIYVPVTAAASKKGLIQALGGDLIEVAGPQYAKTEACMKAAETITYASHAWSPYFLLGQMTVAWEVWEQMDGECPDVVICPVGHGGLFLGFYRGFQALKAAGLIERLPRLVAVQASACNPIVQAWERGAEQPVEVQASATVADGIIVDHPTRGQEVLAAIRETGGTAISVEDDAIVAAQKALWSQALIAELTSAVTLAGLQTLDLGDQKVVLALTGNGLKTLS